MNIVNMQKVLDYIKAHPDEFTMQEFGDMFNPSCKSPACICGTANFLYACEQEQTFNFCKDLGDTRTGATYLGLTQDCGEALFYSSDSIWMKYQKELDLEEVSLSLITQQHAITMLENLISGKWDFSGIESLEV